MCYANRCLGTYKGNVRNRLHPEASIAQYYILEECMSFCRRYLDESLVKSNQRTPCNDRNESHSTKREGFRLNDVTRQQIHRYILNNMEIIDPYRE